MQIKVLTLFPEMIEAGLGGSIIGRAREKNLLSVDAVNIRDYAFNKHNSVDDYIYGGGAGMLMQAEPVYQAVTAAKNSLPEEIRDKTRVIYMSPQGSVFDQSMAVELAKEESLIFLCGHYEGIDERVIEECVDECISIGDYVLTGGELPAMVIIDALARNIPGVLHNDESTQSESHSEGLLEYPQYSRPEIWHDKKVPDILLSGHHANVEKWRREQAVIRTAMFRPDMIEQAELSPKERELAMNVMKNNHVMD